MVLVGHGVPPGVSFSALQRAEIAEIVSAAAPHRRNLRRFSALQRAEIAEIWRIYQTAIEDPRCFSALQRAEIAEIRRRAAARTARRGFSALQRAEIAEMTPETAPHYSAPPFQCSSTSRNC